VFYSKKYKEREMFSMPKSKDIPLKKIDNYRWSVSKDFSKGMRVDGLIYADEELIKKTIEDNAIEQVVNVAHLPGIVKYSLAMPDLHWGYGFVIGGVAAMDVEKGGIVTPGGIGYDINCGVRLMRTDLKFADVKDKIRDLVDVLFDKIPCGVGSEGSIRLSNKDEKAVLEKGAVWVVENGYGIPEDIDSTEEGGCLNLADASRISKRALDRGRRQLGTLGSGNHFLEVQVVDRIFDRNAADVLGLFENQISVMIHTGSRGFGHQVCDEHVKTWGNVTQKYNIDIPDRQLVSAPIDSPEGQEYIASMACAANFAWANRQCIMHWTREALENFFNASSSELGLELIYDVAHNIGKFENHNVNGKERRLFVHRKGATRAFSPGHPDVPEKYRDIGQPVIIPGDMGTASYVLVGTQKAMDETWGTTCHGAGRMMSRNEAIRSTKGRSIQREMESQGIYVRWTGRNTLKEEQPEAYKDVDKVVEVVHGAGISKRVARMRPLGVVKG